MEEKNIHSVSMLGSKYSWSDVDRRTSELNFKNRSGYIQNLVEKDIDGFKISFRDIFLFVSILLTLSLTLVILLVITW